MRMLVEEWRVVAVVCLAVMDRKALQRRAGTITDAGGEGLHTLHKAWPHIGAAQQHSGQPQHHIQLRLAVQRQCLHCAPQRSRCNARFKVGKKRRYAAIEFTLANRIQSPA